MEEGTRQRFQAEICPYNSGVGDAGILDASLYMSDAAAWLDGAAERDPEEDKAASCIIE